MLFELWLLYQLNVCYRYLSPDTAVCPLMGVMVELIGAEVDVSTEGLLLLLRSV